jgi:3-hydroxypropanoate dehydrogenase
MLSHQDLKTLFSSARSQNGWLDKPINNSQIHQLYNLMKFAPTAANTCPARIVFVQSDTAKQQLKKYLDDGNVEKSMTAPIVAIIAYDTEFYEQLPKLFPHTDARSWYVGKDKKIKQVGEMNANLQGAYLIMAARSIGLDCGPIGGFDNISLDKKFFSDGKIKSLFLCSLGYGDETKLFPRSPRLDFDEACKII